MGCLVVMHSRSGLAAILGMVILSAHALPAQAPASQQGKRERPAEEIPYVLHITTREVAIDVMAVDGHDRSVTDLAAGALHVIEKVQKKGEVPESISSLRLIDPDAMTSADLPSGGFRIAANESCLSDSQFIINLSTTPDHWRSYRAITKSISRHPAGAFAFSTGTLITSVPPHLPKQWSPKQRRRWTGTCG